MIGDLYRPEPVYPFMILVMKFVQKSPFNLNLYHWLITRSAVGLLAPNSSTLLYAWSDGKPVWSQSLLKRQLRANVREGLNCSQYFL